MIDYCFTITLATLLIGTPQHYTNLVFIILLVLPFYGGFLSVGSSAYIGCLGQFQESKDNHLNMTNIIDIINNVYQHQYGTTI